jgi:hypothetical protein
VSRRGTPGAALAVLFALLVWPAVLAGGGRTSEAADQAAVHLPLIRELARTWPDVDLARYGAATGPGYHLALATVARFVSGEERALRLAGSLFALLLLAAVWRAAARPAGERRAALLVLPLLTSAYTLGAAIWLTTDDAALAFAALAAGGALAPPPTAAAAARRGLWAACAVFVRQVHAWTAVPVFLAARGDGSVRRTAVAAAAALAPLAILAFFVSRWGGLVQPEFAEFHAGANAANVLLALALCGAYGPFFLPAAGVPLRRALRPDRLGAMAAGTGLAIGLLVPSAYDMDAGRWAGPAWRVLGRTAVVADRALPMVLLAAAGAVTVARLAAAAVGGGRRRETLLLAATGAAWVAAQSMNAQAFQRYLEPPVLIGLAWLTALAPRPAGRAAEAGPALLALLLLAGSAATIYRPIFMASP